MPFVNSSRGTFGPQSQRQVLGPGLGAALGTSSSNPATSAIQIRDNFASRDDKEFFGTSAATPSNGVYWIKNANMTTAVQVYCDFTFDGGGWMLLSYGYVDNVNDTTANRALPNLNHNGTRFSYTPTSRASSHGLVNPAGSQQSALKLARASTQVIMAAGGNPSTGGINSYTYAWRFNIPNPSALTFANHTYAYNSSMTTTSVTVTGLKGETGTYTRSVIVEALGTSWTDSYPSGYGPVLLNAGTAKAGNWNEGPHFPSVHSGSRGIAPTNPGLQTSEPDIGVSGYSQGSYSYTYRGFYTATTVNNTGQTSMWFR